MKALDGKKAVLGKEVQQPMQRTVKEWEVFLTRRSEGMALELHFHSPFGVRGGAVRVPSYHRLLETHAAKFTLLLSLL